MNRSDLQNLSQMRLSDAKTLLATGTNDAGAYYMAGYAVECAIKACIAKNQGLYPFPPKIKDSDYYTHSISRLMETAELTNDFRTDTALNPDLQRNWSYVFQWNETFRYQPNILRLEAENLVNAVEDAQNGVLSWLQNRW